MLATSLTETGAQLAEQLGLSWAKFLAQTLNFLIVLAVLWKFAYRPVLNMLAERKRLIEEGLAGAEKGRTALLEAEAQRRKILSEAEARAEKMVTEARAAADVQGAQRLADAQSQGRPAPGRRAVPGRKPCPQGQGIDGAGEVPARG